MRLIIEATLPALATPNAEPAEPIEKIEAKLPTDPMLSSESRLAMHSTELCEASDHDLGMPPACHACAQPGCRRRCDLNCG